MGGGRREGEGGRGHLEAAAAHPKGHAVHVDGVRGQLREGGAGAGGLGVLALPPQRLVGAGVGVDRGGEGDGAPAALADVGGERGEARVRVDGLVGDVDGPVVGAFSYGGIVRGGPAKTRTSTPRRWGSEEMPAA